MSRVLVIPDVHLKPWIFDMADKIDKSSYGNQKLYVVDTESKKYADASFIC